MDEETALAAGENGWADAHGDFEERSTEAKIGDFVIRG